MQHVTPDRSDANVGNLTYGEQSPQKDSEQEPSPPKDSSKLDLKVPSPKLEVLGKPSNTGLPEAIGEPCEIQEDIQVPVEPLPQAEAIIIQDLQKNMEDAQLLANPLIEEGEIITPARGSWEVSELEAIEEYIMEAACDLMDNIISNEDFVERAINDSAREPLVTEDLTPEEEEEILANEQSLLFGNLDD